MPESDNTMVIRSNGISAEGVRDQYADVRFHMFYLKNIRELN